MIMRCKAMWRGQGILPLLAGALVAMALWADTACAAGCYLDLEVPPATNGKSSVTIKSKYGNYLGQVQELLPGYPADVILYAFASDGSVLGRYVTSPFRQRVAERFEGHAAGALTDAPAGAMRLTIPWNERLSRLEIEQEGERISLGTVDAKTLQCAKGCRDEKDSLSKGESCCEGLHAAQNSSGALVCRRCGDNVCSAGEELLCPADCTVTASSMCAAAFEVDFGCGDLSTYYEFEGNLKNSAGPLYSGAASGALSFKSEGLLGRALQLGGQGAVITRNFQAPGPASISIWFQGVEGNVGTLYSVGDTSRNGYAVLLDGDRRLVLRLGYRGRVTKGNSTFMKSFRTTSKAKGSIAAGWNHAVLVRKPDAKTSRHRWTLYLNNKRVLSRTSAYAPAFRGRTPLTLGAERSGGRLQKYFAGSLDQVSVWYRALSAEGQRRIYESGNFFRD